MKEARVIFAPQLARFLLQRGFEIIDIKPDRKKERDVVFVFRNVDGLENAIQEFIGTKTTTV